MQPHDTFTGSYQPGDVEFLLKPVVIEMTPVEQKEELIQSGKKHYSDMLSQEPAPTQWHLDLFHRALDRGAERLAKKSHSSLLLWPNALVMSPLYWPVLSGLACRSALCCTGPCVTWGKPHGITVSALSGIVELTVQPSTSLKSGMVPAVLSLLTDGQVKAQLPESLYAH